MDFYRCSNTHDPDQDGFEDLYCRDFIHAISRVACCKLSCHHLDPYQRAALHCRIVCHNTGKEEANPTFVRESPPPTPREAYLPQRPERAQKREASEMRLTHPLAGRRARKTKQKPKATKLTQRLGGRGKSETRRPH